LDKSKPDAIHIATEGPLGVAARSYCLSRDLAFTTAYHTRFPEYVAARLFVPLRWTYAWLRRFHAPSRSIMVAAPSIARELRARGFDNIRPWTRGVDSDLFQPERREELPDLPRPIFLTVGRVAVEKNVKAFLDIDLPGSKVVVGDGPQLEELQRKHPEVRFLGRKEGTELARLYASADVFVFPSLTDTFGLVLLEALASGLPVAAFPVPGPMDVIGDAPVGRLDRDLRQAALGCLDFSPSACREHALRFSWRNSAQQFLDNLAPAKS
ncbi:MAG TPA: glycosyltransferase family 1 protein, partial [Stellaceae bacterium]|nr:glycosyltransferase family 1 protein [Stellaceae bacterium]